jgi:hypothetical protein
MILLTRLGVVDGRDGGRLIVVDFDSALIIQGSVRGIVHGSLALCSTIFPLLDLVNALRFEAKNDVQTLL